MPWAWPRALLWGSTTLVVRASRLSQASAELTLFYQLAVSGVLLTALAWTVGEPWPVWQSLPAQAWWLLAFSSRGGDVCQLLGLVLGWCGTTRPRSCRP